MIESPHLKNLMASQALPGEGDLVNIRIYGTQYYGYTRIKCPVKKKSRQIEFKLGVTVGEPDHHRLVQIALGEKLAQIRRGELPNLTGQDFRKVAAAWKENPVCLKGKPHGTKDNLLILFGEEDRKKKGESKCLVKYFGDFKVQEIINSPELVLNYYREREAEGIKKSTLDKERRVLRWVMQSVSRTWEPPYYEFKNQAKEKPDEPLSVYQVFQMIHALAQVQHGEEYQEIAHTMAFTGLDTSDVVDPDRQSLVDGVLTGYRRKTGKRYRIGLSQEIESFYLRRMSMFPRYKIPSADAVSAAISRTFDEIGLPQFHAKSLRDFYASILYNAGYEDNFIQDQLGQERGSKQTQKYTLATIKTLKKTASLFDDLNENRRAYK